MCPACLTALAITAVAATTGVSAGAAATAFVVRTLGARVKKPHEIETETETPTRKVPHEHLETNRDA